MIEIYLKRDSNLCNFILNLLADCPKTYYIARALTKQGLIYSQLAIKEPCDKNLEFPPIELQWFSGNKIILELDFNLILNLSKDQLWKLYVLCGSCRGNLIESSYLYKCLHKFFGYQYFNHNYSGTYFQI